MNGLKPLVTLSGELLLQGITQGALAGKAKVPKQYISDAIRGKRNLDNDQKIRIARALGKSVQEIFPVEELQS